MGNLIKYGAWEFDDDHIDSGNVFLASSLLSSQLQVKNLYSQAFEQSIEMRNYDHSHSR